MMKRKVETDMTRTLSALALAATLATPVFAAGPITEGDLAVIDANGDGIITEDEYVAYMDTIFAAIDEDNTGSISFADIDILLTRTQHEQMDADGDGLVSREEYDAQMRRDYLAADLDGNGVLN